ncbi:MAG TPA: TlpA disulfide reductase family protein [Pyrinomonadaceae bacterium]|nr:TlpA disulfide reductase family protein [Pyrinomonadaceae bacterium]
MILSRPKAALALLVFVASATPFTLIKTLDVTATANQQPELHSSADVGEAAPEFQLRRMDGRTISLADFRGHPAVLIFWTSWCSFCKAEAPEFNRLVRRYRAKGVRLLGINVQDSEKRTRAGIRDFGIRYPVVRDVDASVARRYQVAATPTVIFLDAQGVVTYRGNRLPEDYDERLEALLRRKAHIE